MANINDIGRGLQGFSAGVAGRGGEFIQGLRQEEQRLDAARSNALLQDAFTTREHLQNNNVGGALSLLDNRLSGVNELGGDPSDTQAMRDMIAGGDISGAINELSIPIDFAVGQGLFKPPQVAGSKEIAQTEKTRAETAKIRAETNKIVSSEVKRLRTEDPSLSPSDIAVIKQERIDTTKKNVARISDLSQGQLGRGSSTAKARRFLKAFKDRTATSGTTRAFADFIPGVFTEQGQFDEEFDSFAETAARSKLKILGETRPTDADVAGMKRSMFSPFRDEKTNVQLLEDFINDQEQLDDELEALNRAKEAGNLSTFTGALKSSQAPTRDLSGLSIEELQQMRQQAQ